MLQSVIWRRGRAAPSNTSPVNLGLKTSSRASITHLPHGFGCPLETHALSIFFLSTKLSRCTVWRRQKCRTHVRTLPRNQTPRNSQIPTPRNAPSTACQTAKHIHSKSTHQHTNKDPPPTANRHPAPVRNTSRPQHAVQSKNRSNDFNTTLRTVVAPMRIRDTNRNKQLHTVKTTFDQHLKRYLCTYVRRYAGQGGFTRSKNCGRLLRWRGGIGRGDLSSPTAGGTPGWHATRTRTPGDPISR